MSIKYFNPHNHTHYSNIRLLDSIIRPENLIDKAIELGLAGIALTDHEALCGHIVAQKHYESIKNSAPDFKLALGNEIYLTETRDRGQKYYHFLLIAKDSVGYKAIKELSSTAWFYSYSDRGMERVPTLKSELSKIINKYKGHVIATTACIGGELSSLALLMSRAESVNDLKNAKIYYDEICNFIDYCLNLFGEDFYIECAPSTNEEQIIVNKKLYAIAKTYNIKMIIGTDSHYLRPEDRPIHKAYLNSREGDREVDRFYEYTYLMSGNEALELMKNSFNDENIIMKMFEDSLDIYNKIENFSLFNKQSIPTVEVKHYPKRTLAMHSMCDSNYPYLGQMFISDDVQNRYWVNECTNKLQELNKHTDERYWKELEEEARVKTIIGEKLETNMFQYPNTLQHYINMIWECGSMVGAGRGSSCAALNHYLMGITQLDPIEWNLPFFRYMNEERTEIGDIDIDICPSKRPVILQKIKEERSHYFNDDVEEWVKNNIGCTLVATFGTEKTKSAVQTACRGYRSEDYPNGIDSDESLYISSLIPEERGFLWSIHEVINGNEEKGRKPVQTFIREVNKYPGLLDIIVNIEGLINHRGSHASGVILFENNPFDNCAFMKTPSGDIITQFDLHDAEYCGLTKYDFLVTEVQDKLVETIKLLQADSEIEPELTLKEVYDKYFHPNKLPLDDKRIWDALGNVSVLNTFQFDSLEGSKVAKKLKPQNVLEMSAANGLMRLMGEEGEERPQDKYARQKENISLWYAEMDREGLTKEEQKNIEPYFKNDYGVPPDQESLMLMLMDKNICGFSLADANAARKIVGKKQMNKIPQLREQVLTQATSSNLGKYIWKHGVGPQMGYSFSKIHALAYSFIGVQTLYIATNWNPIYWDTACLIINSGSLEDNSEEELVDIYAPEADDIANGVTFEDLPDRSGKIRKTASTDYSKVAKALGDIINSGVKVGLVDINKSDFGFKPDVENNQILFGMKALLNVSDDIVKEIINKRPYTSPKDFLLKVKPKKQAMISLIKSGAFDSMIDRKECMIWYLWTSCDKKKRLTLQNMPGLIKYNLLPEDTDEQIKARRVYEFNRYLKAICKNKQGFTNDYLLDERAINFLTEINLDNLIDIVEDNNTNSSIFILNIKKWDKFYQKEMNVFRNWIASDKENILKNLNIQIFQEEWNKYALVNSPYMLSAWEMETMCFYYHEHELNAIDYDNFGFSNFHNLPPQPIINRTYMRGKNRINIYNLNTICGTCIAKNKTKSTVSLLTTSGVVNVKFRKDHFALFDKQISVKNEQGVKKVVEKSWFNRGNMIVVQGIRSDDNFIVKKYASTSTHSIYKINEVYKDGTLSLTSERAIGDN